MEKQFSLLLRSFREKYGLKQAVLAERLGVTQATLSRYENGLSEPTLAMRAKLKDLLYKPPEADLRRMVREVHGMFSLQGYGRAIVTGPEARLIAHSMAELDRMRGYELMPTCSDAFRRVISEQFRGIQSGEVLTLQALMETPRFDGNNFAGNYHAINTLSFYLTHIGVVADMRNSIVADHDWNRLGAREQFKIVTLDDV